MQELSDGAPDEGGPAQMGSTSSADTGPSALLRAVGFGAARGGGQGTSRGADGAAEATSSSHAAHFHDLIMNSLAGGGGFSFGAAGFGAMDDDGNLSTQDFLGVGGAPDPAQMNYHALVATGGINEQRQQNKKMEPKKRSTGMP
ncbi:hypothetical protein PVAP13_2KG414705 [Panicum virgatum]|uniref:Uncharacterized protein n=1 Tax=Panicum virgatum TaxID=38727 RepID=A0A8T0WKH2_PANVG|nr:hypothetical protein PVAP13_2KG414705 [Panicum virgatum]